MGIAEPEAKKAVGHSLSGSTAAICVHHFTARIYSEASLCFAFRENRTARLKPDSLH